MSGSCLGPSLVGVRFVFGFVSGLVSEFASGSRVGYILVRIWFVSGFVPTLVSGFASGSRPESWPGSCLLRG